MSLPTERARREPVIGHAYLLFCHEQGAPCSVEQSLENSSALQIMEHYKC